MWLPSSWKLKLLLLFTSTSGPPHTRRRGKDARASNIHIYLHARLFQPLQILCTPKHWLPSWANPSAMSTSLSQGALLFLLLCLNTATRCFLPVWTSDETLLMPVLLANHLASPSGHCPLTGGLLVFGNAVLLTVPTAFACCVHTVLLG